MESSGSQKDWSNEDEAEIGAQDKGKRWVGREGREGTTMVRVLVRDMGKRGRGFRA